MAMWWVLAVLQPAASGAFDLAALPRGPAGAGAIGFRSAERCGVTGAADTVTVCGMRNRDRYRLPLPRDPGPVRGDVPGGSAALTPPGPCGIFVGERRCGKAEAAAYGYGGGRDPVTVVTRVVSALLDPDP